MALSNGDIEMEKEYLRQKYAMTRVAVANPPTEKRALWEGGMVFENSAILYQLAEKGFTASVIESKIPAKIGDWAPLGTLYGTYIGVDHYGRLQFGENPLYLESQEPQIAALEIEQPTDQCEHGFVVHDVQEQNHFLCRECGDRFHRHPDMIEQEMFRPDDAEVYDYIAQFRDGLVTFTEAVKQTSLELDEFVKAMNFAFPPEEVYQDQYSIGSQGPIGKELAYIEPARTSCPAEIERVFGSPEATLDLINSVVNGGVFPDIEEVRHIDHPELKQMHVEIEFIDGSVQKVVIDHMLTADYGLKMKRRIDGSRHIMRADGRSSKGSWDLTPFQVDMLKAKPKAYAQYEKDAGQITHNMHFDYNPPKDIRSPWQ